MPIQAPKEKPATQQARASGFDGLRPVERRGRVRQFAGAVVERALAAADAAEIESQHREATMRERIVALVDDLVIHRAVELRMRVQDHRDRRVLLLGRMVAAFETAGGAGENNFRHDDLLIDPLKTLFNNQPIVRISSAAGPIKPRMEGWSGALG
ncbi:hypothetical protein ACVWXM_008813 [Bradyrhizobium sp. GM7.3]